MSIVKSKADSRELAKLKRQKEQAVLPMDPRSIAERTLAAGVTPVEVMAVTMRRYFGEAEAAYQKYEDTPDGTDEKKFARIEYVGAAAEACAIAKDVAPYLHPKLSSVSMEVSADSDTLEAFIVGAAELRSLVRGRTPMTIEHDQT